MLLLFISVMLLLFDVGIRCGLSVLGGAAGTESVVEFLRDALADSPTTICEGVAGIVTNEGEEENEIEEEVDATVSDLVVVLTLFVSCAVATVVAVVLVRLFLPSISVGTCVLVVCCGSTSPVTLLPPASADSSRLITPLVPLFWCCGSCSSCSSRLLLLPSVIIVGLSSLSERCMVGFEGKGDTIPACAVGGGGGGGAGLDGGGGAED